MLNKNFKNQCRGFVQDAKEQFTVSDYGIENLYGGFDHISGSPAEGKISWISLPPDEQEAIQLQSMQAGLSPDLYYAEAGEWVREHVPMKRNDRG